MKNQIYRVVALIGIFFGLAVAAVQGQAPTKVEVNIPFEFSAGKTTLQPGRYSIKRMSGNLLVIRNSKDNSEVILNAPVTLGEGNEKASERLVFNKDGDRYFLTQIWLSVDSGRRVLTEKNIAKAERVEISLRRR